MDSNVAILVNSTPGYYYILPFFFGMLRRYGEGLQWTVYLGSEQPDHPICREVAEKYGVEVVPIPSAFKGFIDSRWYCLNYLEGRHEFVLPLQDDFILEMPLREDLLGEILRQMVADETIASVRLMPCPGPAVADAVAGPRLRELSHKHDTYGFTYQATLWRWYACRDWFQALSEKLQAAAPREFTDPKARVRLEVSGNIAENAEGQRDFWALSAKRGWRHLAWERAGPWPNAVYLSPFPYRPTAIVRGALEGWAIELARREGFTL
jgi:hypothetical protein